MSLCSMGPSKQSMTKEYETPEGDVFITGVFNPNGTVYRIFVSAGKTGEITYAAGDALGSITGIALRYGVGRDRLAMALREVTHEDSRVLGFTAKSVSDALGRFLQDHVPEIDP